MNNEQLHYFSSTYPVVLDSYMKQRLVLGDFTGSKILLRIKSLQILTNPSDASFRRGIATFFFMEEGGDVVYDLMMKSNKGVSIEFHFRIDSRNYTIENIFLLTIDALLQNLTSGVRKNSLSEPRNVRYLHYKKALSTFSKVFVANVVHKTCYGTVSFNEPLEKISEQTLFSTDKRFTVNAAYEQNKWLDKSCALFVSEFLNGVFIKQTPNKH